MKTKIISSTILVLTITNFLFAQNPFESLGVKNIKVLTYSNGKFNEFFDNDSIVQIGSILFNTKSNEIVAFVERNTMYSEATLKPEITSRWLSPDPLAAKFTDISPYVYANNNPIYFIDPDGKAIKPASGEDKNALSAFFDNGFTDKKGISVDAFHLFGITPTIFMQKTSRDPIRIYSSNLSPSEFANRLKNSKLSKEDKEYAQSVYQKLSSKDVYELAVVSVQSQATGFINPNETNGVETKVQTENSKSDNIFKAIESTSLTTSDKEKTIKDELGEKDFGYFPDESPNSNVKGIIIIYQQVSSSSSSRSPGKSSTDEKKTNELIKEAIDVAPK